MKTESSVKQLRSIRLLIAGFILCLIASGITAFPLEWEVELGEPLTGHFPPLFKLWFSKVSEGIYATNRSYPFMAYGTDWLAFSHIIIALFFIAPFRDPVKYLLIIDIGIWACLLVFPLALCCGPLRSIPFFWQMIDCSFGLLGGSLLLFIRRRIIHLQLNPSKKLYV
jgi:hypothetical protein